MRWPVVDDSLRCRGLVVGSGLPIVAACSARGGMGPSPRGRQHKESIMTLKIYCPVVDGGEALIRSATTKA